MSVRLDKLVKSRRREDRWYAEFSNGEGFSLSVALIADFSLFTGRELEDEEFAALRAAAGRLNCRARALRILGSRMLSRRELMNKLKEKGETEEDAEAAVDFLESMGFIDAAESAAALVRHYSKRGYGPARVKDELYRRGVPKELWEAAMEELPEDTEAIDALIDRRLRDLSDVREVKRVTDMLLRRGYSYEQVKSAMLRRDIREELE